MHGKTIGSVGSLEPYLHNSSVREESPLSGKSCGVCLRYMPVCALLLTYVLACMSAYSGVAEFLEVHSKGM